MQLKWENSWKECIDNYVKIYTIIFLALLGIYFVMCWRQHLSSLQHLKAFFFFKATSFRVNKLMYHWVDKGISISYRERPQVNLQHPSGLPWKQSNQWEAELGGDGFHRLKQVLKQNSHLQDCKRLTQRRKDIDSYVVVESCFIVMTLSQVGLSGQSVLPLLIGKAPDTDSLRDICSSLSVSFLLIISPHPWSWYVRFFLSFSIL